MPAWLWITAVALAGLAVFVALGRRWWRVKWLLDWALVLSVPRWWYSMRHAAHVMEETAAEYGPGTFYGSAILGEELTWRNSSPLTIELDGVPDWLPAPAVDPEPWRAQMTAELSPEALAVCPCGKPIDHTEFCYDSGPGATSSLVAALGPVPSFPVATESRSASPGIAGGALQVAPAIPSREPSRWLAEQLEILRAWSERQQAYAEILA